LTRLPWRLVACIAIAWAVLTACSGRPELPARSIHEALEAVRLARLSDGIPVSAQALHGPLVINFWASWCAPCRNEMPALERLSSRLAPDGITVVGITLDNDLNLAREFVHAYRLSFPMYTGAESLRVALGVKALPHTLLVRSDGTLAAALAGARDWDSEPVDAHVRERLAHVDGRRR